MCKVIVNETIFSETCLLTAPKLVFGPSVIQFSCVLLSESNCNYTLHTFMTFGYGCHCSNIVMSKGKDNVRMKWSENCIKHFLEACIQEVNQIGRKNEGSLQRQSWTNVGKQLQEVCDLEVTQKQMRNEYDHLKWKFFEWAYLKQTMPDRYNSETNSFNLTNEEWEDFLKVC